MLSAEIYEILRQHIIRTGRVIRRCGNTCDIHWQGVVQVYDETLLQYSSEMTYIVSGGA